MAHLFKIRVVLRPSKQNNPQKNSRRRLLRSRAKMRNLCLRLCISSRLLRRASVFIFYKKVQFFVEYRMHLKGL